VVLQFIEYESKPIKSVASKSTPKLSPAFKLALAGMLVK